MTGVLNITQRTLITAIAALIVAGAGTAAVREMYQQRAQTTRSPKHFTMRGSVSGLYPGGARTLSVIARNPSKHPISVGKVSVRVARSTPGCAASNLAVASRPRKTLVRASRTAPIKVRLRMRASAPDACQRATFVLKLSAKATR